MKRLLEKAYAPRREFGWRARAERIENIGNAVLYFVLAAILVLSGCLTALNG